MPAGLRIKRNKKWVVEATDRIGKFIGSFVTDGNVTGGFTDVNIIGKEFFYFSLSPSGYYGGPFVSGNSSSGFIEWNYSATVTGTASGGLPADRVHTVYYGYY